MKIGVFSDDYMGWLTRKAVNGEGAWRVESGEWRVESGEWRVEGGGPISWAGTVERQSTRGCSALL
jgi:hypothetical protein